MTQRTLKAMIESDTRSELTMGCEATQLSCTICGRELVDDRSHVHYADGTWEEISDMQFVASFVESPPCEGCGDRVIGIAGSMWACPNNECERYNQPLQLDIFPLQSVVNDG